MTAWRIATMHTDCYFLNSHGDVVQPVIGTKCYDYTTTVAIFKMLREMNAPSKRTVKTFTTALRFAVTPRPKSILRERDCSASQLMENWEYFIWKITLLVYTKMWIIMMTMKLMMRVIMT